MDTKTFSSMDAKTSRAVLVAKVEAADRYIAYLINKGKNLEDKYNALKKSVEAAVVMGGQTVPAVKPAVKYEACAFCSHPFAVGTKCPEFSCIEFPLS